MKYEAYNTKNSSAVADTGHDIVYTMDSTVPGRSSKNGVEQPPEKIYEKRNIENNGHSAAGAICFVGLAARVKGGEKFNARSQQSLVHGSL